MFFDSIMSFDNPGVLGPFSAAAALLSPVATEPVEGVWAFSGAAKVASLEVYGSGITSLSLQAWGTNAIAAPLNQYQVTFAGSPAVGNVVTLTFTNPNLPGGQRVVSYTLAANPTAAIVAAAIAALVGSDTYLAPLGFLASAAGAVVTIAYPSASANQTSSPSSPAIANQTTLLAGVSAGVTTTVAFGTNGVALGSAITSTGLTSLTPIPRWVTVRLTTLTGAPPMVGVNLNGAC